MLVDGVVAGVERKLADRVALPIGDLDGVLFIERMASLDTLSFLDEFQRFSTGPRDE